MKIIFKGTVYTLGEVVRMKLPYSANDIGRVSGYINYVIYEINGKLYAMHTPINSQWPVYQRMHKGA